MELKNRDGKIQWESGKIIPKHFAGMKEYVQQRHNDLKNTLQAEFQLKNIRSMQF